MKIKIEGECGYSLYVKWKEGRDDFSFVVAMELKRVSVWKMERRAGEMKMVGKILDRRENRKHSKGMGYHVTLEEFMVFGVVKCKLRVIFLCCLCLCALYAYISITQQRKIKREES